jgi:hypothetical protein
LPKIYYNEHQLKEILHYNEDQSQIYLPNEIFDELKDTIDLKVEKRSCEHLAYAYSYIYLVTYLYRYAVYGNGTNGLNLITEKDLRKILQTCKDSRFKDYLTKEGGLLQKLNYIRKTRDFPVAYQYEEDHCDSFLVKPIFITLKEFLEEFEMELDFIHKGKIPPRYKINFPFRAFYDCEVNAEDGYIDHGYFYNYANTHMIPVEVFLFCMGRDDLGTLGFYLYSFLKKMTDQNRDGWQCSRDNLIKFTGLKRTTLLNTLKTLESYNMINNSHEEFYYNYHYAKGKNKPKLKANTYKALKPVRFVTVKQDVKTRDVINCMDLEDVIEQNDKAEHYMPQNEIDFSGDEVWT